MKDYVQVRIWFSTYFKDSIQQEISYETTISQFEIADSQLIFRLIRSGIISKMEINQR